MIIQTRVMPPTSDGYGKRVKARISDLDYELIMPYPYADADPEETVAVELCRIATRTPAVLPEDLFGTAGRTYGWKSWKVNV